MTIDILRTYQEQHFQNVEDVGIAFDGIRIWICFNGVAVLRAKVFPDGLSIEYHPPLKDIEK